MQSFLEHRKMRIREGIADSDSFFKGVDQLVELLRIDLKDAIEVKAPLCEDVFHAKEMEKILKEDLNCGKLYVRSLTRLMKEHLAKAIIHDIYENHESGMDGIKSSIAGKIDKFIQNVGREVNRTLASRSTSAPDAGRSIPTGVPSPQVPPSRSASPQVPPSSSASPQDFGSYQQNVHAGDDYPEVPDATDPKRKGPGFWGGMKNLWKNMVWNPLKKAWYDESVIERMSLIFEDNNKDVLAKVKIWGDELRDFVLDQIPGIIQMGQQMSPEELASLSNDAESLDQSSSDELEVDPNNGTLPVNTVDSGFPDDEVQGRTTPEEVQKKNIKVSKMLLKLEDQFPELDGLGNKAQCSFLMRKIFDHLGLGASHIKDPVKLADRIGDRLSQFQVIMPRGSRQDPNVEKEPFKLIDGSWGKNKSIIAQLAYHVLIQGESLPEAIKDVQDSPEISSGGSLTGSGPPTMDDPNRGIPQNPESGRQDVVSQDQPNHDPNTLVGDLEDKPSPEHNAKEVLSRVQKKHPRGLAALIEKQTKLNNTSSNEALNGLVKDMITWIKQSNPVDVENNLIELCHEFEQEMNQEKSNPETNSQSNPEESPFDSDEENPFDVAPEQKTSSGIEPDDPEFISGVNPKTGDKFASYGGSDDDQDYDTSSSNNDDWDYDTKGDQEKDDPNTKFKTPEKFVNVDDDMKKSPEEIARVAQDAAEAEEIRKKSELQSKEDRDLRNSSSAQSNSSFSNWEVDSPLTAGNLNKATKETIQQLNKNYSQEMNELESDFVNQGLTAKIAKQKIQDHVKDIISGEWDNTYKFGTPISDDDVITKLLSLMHQDEEIEDDEDDDFDELAAAADAEESLTGESRLSDIRKRVFAD